ncbi:hypothetical protein SODG_007519 [Sodalis praecaptivus]
MTGSSILFTPDFGYAGALTRPSHSTVEPVVMSTDKPFAGDGLMGKKVDGKFVPISEGDAVTVFSVFVCALTRLCRTAIWHDS